MLSAFIEMAQNIVHYSADAMTDAGALDDEVRFGAIRIAQGEAAPGEARIGEVGAGAASIALTCSNPVDLRTYERLAPKLQAAQLHRVRVYETPDLFADFYGEA